MILLLLACGSAPLDMDKDPCDFYTNRAVATCPCRTFSAPAASGVTCRPDQGLRIEWEPALEGARFENEDRVGGVVVCECRP